MFIEPLSSEKHLAKDKIKIEGNYPRIRRKRTGSRRRLPPVIVLLRSHSTLNTAHGMIFKTAKIWFRIKLEKNGHTSFINPGDKASVRTPRSQRVGDGLEWIMRELREVVLWLNCSAAPAILLLPGGACHARGFLSMAAVNTCALIL